MTGTRLSPRSQRLPRALLAVVPLLAIVLSVPVLVRAGGEVPEGAEVFPRAGDTRLAYVHGDHWHGRITLDAGQEREFDVRFVDQDDNVMPLAAGQSVRAAIVAGQPERVVSIENHGDHFKLRALSAGETRIVIHLWHDDHADWSTPPLRVVVNAVETPQPTPTAPASGPATASPTAVATGSPAPQAPATGTGQAADGGSPNLLVALLGMLILGGSVAGAVYAYRWR